MPRLIDLLMPRRRSGAGLAGCLLLFVYVFAMWHWNRDLQRQEAIGKLQQKIVAWIDRQAPKQGGYSWDDLTRALIVTREDRDFLDRQGYEYRPLEAGSPPDRILFLQKKGPNEERFIYKDGSHGYERRWLSPDGKHVLIDLPGHAAPSTLRTLRFLALGEPGVMGEYVVDGYQRPALWNSTGDLVAMNATLVDSEHPIVVFRLAKATVEVVECPEELTLTDLLSREVQHRDARWSMEFLDARGWPAPNNLLVHLQGTGSYIDRASGAKHGFNLIYDVLLEVTPRNECRVKSRSKRHFAASEFR